MPRLPLLKKPIPKSLNRSKSKTKILKRTKTRMCRKELTCFSRSRARSRYSSRSNFLRKVLSTPTAYGNTQTTPEFKTHITYRPNLNKHTRFQSIHEQLTLLPVLTMAADSSAPGGLPEEPPRFGASGPFPPRVTRKLPELAGFFATEARKGWDDDYEPYFTAEGGIGQLRILGVFSSFLVYNFFFSRRSIN